MKKIALTLVIVGFLTALAGFVYGVVEVNIPYQDPTPQQAWHQARGHAITDAILVVGAIQFLVGLILAVIGFLVRRLRGKTANN